MRFTWGTVSDTPNGIERLKNAMEKAEAIVIGAGAGLSSAL